MDNLEILVIVLIGLAAAIPFIVKFIKYMQGLFVEKDWDGLIVFVIRLMEEAEKNFDNGADKKSWVLNMIAASADAINCEVDMDKLSKLIDALAALAKVVNVQK